MSTGSFQHGAPTDRPEAEVVDGVARAYPPPAPDEAQRLHDGLSAAADGSGLLDIAYRTVDSPYGSLLVAATREGVVRIAFDLEGHDHVLSLLAATVSPRILRSGRRTDDVARQLDEYFAGHRRAFDVPVDLRLVGGFRRDVLAQLRRIPYGSTESYAAVARAAGNARAVCAAGSACSHNPVPVVVPCHRVVRSDGSIGQYLGGTGMKAALLAMEAAA
jgi:methylated-DNA-[protein]-cysteine S-methyltransferase